MALSFVHIEPDWPAPANILALSTSRLGGSSKPPYNSLNLGHHVGDAPDAVKANRRLLQELLPSESQVQWLQQQHGTRAVHVNGQCDSESYPEADSAYTSGLNKACVVLTADCLPVLLCNEQGTLVAASHAGWRGLSNGVLESLVKSLPCPANELMVWLGPAIGPQAFEVGAEVRQAFLQDSHQPDAHAHCFENSGNSSGRYLANLYELARIRLSGLGINKIYGGTRCTFSEPDHFFSYRRDGQTGRMASLILIKSV
ncbi:MAG: peptidoglycan editing factor PgeF [Halioglobus sp.]